MTFFVLLLLEVHATFTILEYEIMGNLNFYFQTMVVGSYLDTE